MRSVALAFFSMGAFQHISCLSHLRRVDNRTLCLVLHFTYKVTCNRHWCFNPTSSIVCWWRCESVHEHVANVFKLWTCQKSVSMNVLVNTWGHILVNIRKVFVNKNVFWMCAPYFYKHNDINLFIDIDMYHLTLQLYVYELVSRLQT